MQITSDPYNQEIVQAATEAVARLSAFVYEGLADSFWSSLTFSDAKLFADLASSIGDNPTAAGIMQNWAEHDPESECDDYPELLAEAVAEYAEAEGAP